MTASSPTLLLYAHDPGGAQSLLAVAPVLERAGYVLQWWADGPAQTMFARSGHTVTSLAETLLAETLPALSLESVSHWLKTQNCQGLLTGTSANVMTEKWLWSAANEQGLPSVALLDQWLNYGIRFSEYGLDRLGFYEHHPTHPYLPNAVAVMDDLAKQELLQAVPELAPEQVWVVGLPQAERAHQGEPIPHTEISPPTVKKNLWVSEPLTDVYGGTPPMGYTEFEALEAVLNEVYAFGKGMTQAHEWIIKCHPKESPHKYEAFLKRYDALPVKLRVVGPEAPTAQLIEESGVVWGMASMALIEAALMGKPVISIQPHLKGSDPLVLARLGWLETCTTHKQVVEACYDVFVDDNLAPYTGRFALPWKREPGSAGQALVNQLQTWVPLLQKEIR